jgi:hypothetical protein
VKHKASILAVTLITLSIILVTALAVSLAAIKQRNASLGSGKSNLAFQNADTGVEEAMNEITGGTSATVGDVCGNLPGTYTGYTVKFFDKDNIELSCSGDAGKSKNEITSIKSVGVGANQESRAIEAAVAAVKSSKICATWNGNGLPDKSFADYLPVPMNWQIDDCKKWAKQVFDNAKNSYAVGCITDESAGSNGVVFGSFCDTTSCDADAPSGTKNCGW